VLCSLRPPCRPRVRHFGDWPHALDAVQRPGERDARDHSKWPAVLRRQQQRSCWACPARLFGLGTIQNELPAACQCRQLAPVGQRDRRQSGKVLIPVHAGALTPPRPAAIEPGLHHPPNSRFPCGSKPLRRTIRNINGLKISPRVRDKGAAKGATICSDCPLRNSARCASAVRFLRESA
jgi:hypothetical protein